MNMLTRRFCNLGFVRYVLQNSCNTYSNLEDLPPAPPGSGSWDWPLSRPERKEPNPASQRVADLTD